MLQQSLIRLITEPQTSHWIEIHEDLFERATNNNETDENGLTFRRGS